MSGIITLKVRIAWLLLNVLVLITTCSILGCQNEENIHTPVNPTYGPDDYYDAIQMISDTGVSVHYTYNRHDVIIMKEEPYFADILGFLEASTIKKVTGKNTLVVENGIEKTVAATIPYAIGYMLYFKLENSDSVCFDCAGQDIWFETDSAIYNASCSQDFWELLSDLINQAPPPAFDLPERTDLIGKIVFQSTRDGNTDVFSVNADGTCLTRLTYNSEYDGDPVWSPDGTKIAFVSLRDSEKYNIWVMNADGTNQSRLTNSVGCSPAWSPDCKQIAFCGGGDIYVMNADGSKQRQLTNTPSNDKIFNDNPSWSPDGAKIVFCSNGNIYVMNANGTDQHPVTESSSWSDTMPCWSPDGSKIVFVSDRDGGIRKIYLMNSDGTGQTGLSLSSETNYEDIHPAWSPDGTKIIYASWYIGISKILVMNSDGTGHAPIAESPTDIDFENMFPNWIKLKS